MKNYKRTVLLLVAAFSACRSIAPAPAPPPGVAVAHLRTTTIGLEWASALGSDSKPTTTRRTAGGPRPYKLAISAADPTVVGKCIVRVVSANGEKSLVAGPEANMLSDEVSDADPRLTFYVLCWFAPHHESHPISFTAEHTIPLGGDTGLVNITTVTNEFSVSCPQPLLSADYIALELDSASSEGHETTRRVVMRASDQDSRVTDVTLDLLTKPDDVVPPTARVTPRLTVFGRVGARDLAPLVVVGLTELRTLRSLSVTRAGCHGLTFTSDSAQAGPPSQPSVASLGERSP